VGSRLPQPVVARRLCDLLRQFPAASSSGVEWESLARVYQQRHKAKLDVASLGYSSPMAAASALLWDVAQVVDCTDLGNPIVALEDGAALTPLPDSVGSWPSLYAALCTMVREHGSPETSASGEAVTLLLSRVASLAQRYKLPDVAGGMDFLTERGAVHRLEGVEQFVQALIGWRRQRVIWQCARGRRASQVVEVLRDELELDTSHEGIVLRCLTEDGRASSAGTHTPRSVSYSDVDSLDVTPLDAAELRGRNSKQVDGIHALVHDAIMGPYSKAHGPCRVGVDRALSYCSESTRAASSATSPERSTQGTPRSAVWERSLELSAQV